MTKVAKIGIAVVVILIIAGVLFWQDRKKRAEYEAQLSATEVSAISTEHIETVLKSSNFAQANFGGTTFVEFEKLGEEKSGPRTTVYVWLYAQEFYEKEGRLEKGTGVSLPLAMYFNNAELVALVAPRDGSLYTEDIQKLFPDSIKQQPLFTDIAAQNEVSNRHQSSLEQKARAQYGSSLRAPEDVEQEATSTEPVL
jgi:hypothetical protein